MESYNQKNIVAIDGPAGAGKSTIAKRLAKILGSSYLDTGAMYRALTLKAINKEIALDDESQLLSLAKDTTIDLEPNENGVRVLLDGKDVSQEIRTVEVTNNTHYAARAPKVREVMVEWQREIGRAKRVVAEGRDIGTVVFPGATKFYLDADIKERSKRRLKELEEQGKSVEAEALKQDMEQRDKRDMTREVGALKQAEDSIYIDSTFLTIDEVIDEMLKHIEK